MTESAQAQSVVVLDQSQVPAARELAASHGVEVEEVRRRGIEPVTAVTLLLMGTAAAVVKEPDGMFGKVISTLPELLFGRGHNAEQVAQAVTGTFGAEVKIEIAAPGGDG